MRSRGPLLVLAGALLMGYGSAGIWVRTTSAREVGGVDVASTVVMTGAEFAPLALPAALLLAVLGGIAFLGRGPARRVLAGLIAVAAVAGTWLIAAGLPAAMAEGGTLAPAPWSALAGGALALAGAVLTARAPREPALLDERYTVEGAPPDDGEWDLAADDPPEPPR